MRIGKWLAYCMVWRIEIKAIIRHLKQQTYVICIAVACTKEDQKASILLTHVIRRCNAFFCIQLNSLGEMTFCNALNMFFCYSEIKSILRNYSHILSRLGCWETVTSWSFDSFEFSWENCNRIDLAISHILQMKLIILPIYQVLCAIKGASRAIFMCLE